MSTYEYKITDQDWDKANIHLSHARHLLYLAEESLRLTHGTLADRIEAFLKGESDE